MARFPVTLLFLLLGLTGACLGGVAPQRLAEPTPVAVLVTLEAADGRMLTPSISLTDALAGELAARNITPVAIEVGQLRERFKTLRTTEQRLAALAEAAPSAKAVVLVEASVTFFSRLSGRYRWEVDARTSVARREALGEALRSDAGVAAFMQYEHEREEAALTFAKKQVLDDALQTVDRFFGGQHAVAPGASVAPVPRGPAAGSSGDVDSVYFVMLDRFANGDSTNDADVGPAPADWHGGDLQGLAAHADWLAGLGVGTVWISPPFLGQGEKVRGHGAFHGYWVHTLGEVAPRVGGASAYGTARQALASRGIGVWLDLVLNHVGYDAPLVTQHPEWFHPRVDIRNWQDPVEAVNASVHGLPDLATEKPEVLAYLLEQSFLWIDRFGVDGFRLDAVKHVGLDFWRRFNRAVLAHAKPGFALIGEVFDGDPLVLARFAKEGEFTGIFDFPMHYALVDVVCKGAAPGAIGAVLGFDRHYGAGVTHVTFLDNHDLPRIASACGGDLAKVALGVELLATLRGQPSITWGTEVGLVGAGEPENRGDMRFEAGHPLVSATRAALLRRREQPALARGATRIEALSDEVLAWTRWIPGGPASFVVLNVASEARRVPIPTWLGAGELEAAPRAVTTAPVFLAPGAPPADRALVRVHFSGASAGENQGTAAVIGGAPELGAWKHGLALGEGGVDVELPAGTVVAWKLVAGDVDSGNISGGSGPRAVTPVAWEPRGNRYLFVPHGAERLTVHARWGV